MYAVIDLETTGLRTSWHDRIVEIAVVRLDEEGQIRDEWCSLVNPGRDLGPQDIHGISAAEARRAPGFAEVAGHVAGLLRGHTVVAHNWSFDGPFLAAEFRRLEVSVPLTPDLGLCTMRLARHYLPMASRSLESCRAAAGLPPHRAHSALHDARAAAGLLACYMSAAGNPAPWAPVLREASRAYWPAVEPVTAVSVQRRRPEEREPHFLARLVDRLPRQVDPTGDAYLDLLDRALLDRHISATEADGLVEAADRLDLARVDVDHLHRQYLLGLATVALEDDVLTVAERQDLDAVAGLVGLPASAVDEALATAEAGRGASARRWELQPGDLVVFTGGHDAAAGGLAAGGGRGRAGGR